jgi:hypothetical protein
MTARVLCVYERASICHHMAGMYRAAMGKITKFQSRNTRASAAKACTRRNDAGTSASCRRHITALTPLPTRVPHPTQHLTTTTNEHTHHKMNACVARGARALSASTLERAVYTAADAV